jgi:hypothetical protein
MTSITFGRSKPSSPGRNHDFAVRTKRMRTLPWFLSLIGAALLGGVLTLVLRPRPPFEPVASVEQLMKGTITSSSDIVFGAVETDVDIHGTHVREPESDEEWDTIRNNAITLMETGNLLMMPGRAKDRGEWMKQSRALVESSDSAVKAAEAKNAAGIFIAGRQIDRTCNACHAKYLEPQEERKFAGSASAAPAK